MYIDINKCHVEVRCAIVHNHKKNFLNENKGEIIFDNYSFNFSIMAAQLHHIACHFFLEITSVSSVYIVEKALK